jgi:hypothetical protein
MHGTPLKRQRKLGVRDDDGGVIAFPYVPRVADLPRGGGISRQQRRSSI